MTTTPTYIFGIGDDWPMLFAYTDTALILSGGGGTGYTHASVVIGPPGAGGRQAVATATIGVAGALTLALTDHGLGYDPNNPPSVTISGDGTGAIGMAAVGRPIDLSGGVLTGELYVANQLAGSPLTVGNGGIAALDLPNGTATFFVPSSVTAGISADQPGTKRFPTRLQVIFTNTLGYRETLAIFPILVMDPRDADATVFPPTQIGVAVAAQIQGPPGPAVSVNGHTGPIQTITAHDVGSYTTAEIDAAVLAATQGALTKIATAAIGGHKVAKVSGGGVAPASSAQAGDYGLVIGVTTGAAAMGASAQIQTAGEMTDLTWAWTLGPVFLGVAGALTQTPPTSALLQQVGIATSATTLLIDIQEPTLRV